MIKIEDLIPLLKEGWVAMDSNGIWLWYDRKPIKDSLDGMRWLLNEKSDWHGFSELEAFDIAPAEDWTQSLIKIERKDK